MTAKNETHFVDVATDRIGLGTRMKQLKFIGKGFARRIMGKFSDIQFLLVDADNTLFDGTMAFEVLVDKVGIEEAKKIDAKWLNSELQGDELLLFGHQLRLEVGITDEDQITTLNRLRDEGRFNDALFEELQNVKQEGIKVIIITRGSLTVADQLAKEYKLDGGYGTKIEHGRIVEMIGTENGFIEVKVPGKDLTITIPVITKMSKAFEHFKQKGIVFEPSKAAHLADDSHDAGEMAQSGMGILYTNPNKKQTSAQRVSDQYGLFDYKLTQTDVRSLTRLLLDTSKMYELPFFTQKRNGSASTNIAKNNGTSDATKLKK